MWTIIKRTARQFWAYLGAVLSTVTEMVVVDGYAGPWFYGVPPYRFGVLPATEVVGLIIACTLIGGVVIFPPFSLARWLAAKSAAACGRKVGPVAAGLSGLVTIVPVVLVMRVVFDAVPLRLDPYNLCFAACGGVVSGLVYWALGGFAKTTASFT